MIKSFGCSFIFGNDLADDGRDQPYPWASLSTWPALIARRLSAEYQCFAKGGLGNLGIADRVFNNAEIDPNDFFIISWTWADRFDYSEPDPNSRNDWQTLMPIDSGAVAQTYYRHLHSEPRDKLTSLIYIDSTINMLRQKQIPFLMTYMDDLILDQKWHMSAATRYLQQQVRPYLNNFDGLTFLEWSRQQGFAISDTLHPLEEAHAAAADYMLPRVKQLLSESTRRRA